ncbi:MAG: ABC transporter permease [Wenzhouxiangellaceae bacterium]|nr:ABC transporter permease [Wenzhouxiangellaceae bacterium]
MEFRRAWRRMLRAPGFSASVVLLIAISIDGMAAVTTAGWSLFARPLPYPNSGQLIKLSAFSGRVGMHMGLSPALVEELDRGGELGRFGIIDQPFDLRLEEGRSLRAVRIDHRLAEVIGLAPLAGRAFGADDVLPGAEPVALISERLWRREFGADPDVVGRNLDLRDGKARIVGVMPRAFAIPESDTSVWLPMELGPEQTGPQTIGQRGSLTVVARVFGTATAEQFEQRIRAMLGPDPRLQMLVSMLEAQYRVRPLRELWASGQRQSLLILATATAVVLLAAWLNLAGLWLARWTGRDHELAIQAALGGRRALALVGVALEYFLLAVPGALLALLFSGLGLELLYKLGVLQQNGPLHAGVTLPTILAGLALIGLGLVPILVTLAWLTRRISGHESRFLGGRSLTARGTGAGLRQVLMVGQIGIAFSLLIALGLLFTSWVNLLDEELGFEKDRLIAVQIISPTGTTMESGPPGSDANVAAAVDRLRELPGVDAVSWSKLVPFGRMEMLSTISLDGRQDEPVPARPRSAGQDFFEVAGIELLSGRPFGQQDAGEGIKTAIVDKAFEDLYMGGSALGRQFGLSDGPDSHAQYSIVGVVASVRHMAPNEESRNPTVYTYSARPGTQVQLLMRTSNAPDLLAADVRNALEQELGPDRVGFVSTLESLVRRTVQDREPQLALMAVFSGLALVLMFYGLYALQSYQVTSRTAEIGLRKAMGATGRGILGRILLRAVWLLPPGLVLGLAGGRLSSRLVGERLYRVSIVDPALWLVVAGGIALTIVIASLIPALRATRIDPMEALRYE